MRLLEYLGRNTGNAADRPTASCRRRPSVSPARRAANRLVTVSACLILTIAALPGGCPSELVTGTAGGLVDAVTAADDSGGTSAVTSPAPPTAQSIDGKLVVEGAVTQRGEYRLFDIGPGVAGQEVMIHTASAFGPTFVVVLLDERYELLRRELISPRNPLTHVLRAATSAMYVGVTPASGTTGGDFRLEIGLGAAAIPAARPQVVYLNFAGGTNVRVHSRAPVSFPAFDAAMAGTRYAGQTAALRAAIVATMREDYAPYNVILVSSDEAPPPVGPYATIQFGGYDDRLLGLADSVDQYNADLGQTAIVYVESFADYEGMGLTVEEMGQMIGNTASHELGHLLGLFHTQKPVDLMDTTGSAWDLARDQGFTVGPLEPTVFPIGYENSPARLADAVGRAARKAEGVTKPLHPEVLRRKLELRGMVREELRCRCGNCLDPDG
jgi:hypothetical protein